MNSPIKVPTSLCARATQEAKQVFEIQSRVKVLAQDSGKLDELEARLQELIQEQESEVIKLRAENIRVRNLQEECQKQLDRLNREAEEQQRQ